MLKNSPVFILLVLLLLLGFACQEKKEFHADDEYLHPESEVIEQEVMPVIDDSLFEQLSVEIMVLRQELTETKQVLERQQKALQDMEQLLLEKEAQLVQQDESLAREIEDLRRLAKVSYIIIFIGIILISVAVILYFRGKAQRNPFKEPEASAPETEMKDDDPDNENSDKSQFLNIDGD